MTLPAMNLPTMLEDLEARADEHERRAQDLRTAMTLLRELYAPTATAVAAPIRGPAPAEINQATVVTKRPPSKADALRLRVLAYFERQTAPVALGALLAELELKDSQVRRVLMDLVASGRLVRRGLTSAARLGLPRVMTTAPPASVASVPPVAVGGTVALEPPAEPPLERRTLEALKAWLLRVQFIGPEPVALGDLLLAIPREYGQVSYQTLSDLVGDLVRDHLVEPVTHGRERFYRRTISQPALPRVDEAALLAKLERVLATGASYDVRELLRNVQGAVTVNQMQLEAVLVRLRTAKLVDRLPIWNGTGARWRAVPGSKITALASLETRAAGATA